MPLLFSCTLAVGALPQLLQRAIGTRLAFNPSGLAQGLGKFPDNSMAEQLVGVLFDGVGSAHPPKRMMTKPPAARRRL